MKTTYFEVRIKVGNDAVQLAADVSEILRKLADRVDEDNGDLVVRDVNGNTVGSAKFCSRHPEIG